MALTFNRFLRDHKDEQSAIGDLARDYIQDCRERGVRSMTAEALEDSLLDGSASTACWDSYYRAVTLWQTVRGR